jgi:hypothetical protein
MASSTSSGGSSLGRAWGRQRNTTISTPTTETAFSRNTAAGPIAAMITPARAGPTARAMLYVALLRATAFGISGRGTSSGRIACQAGAVAALPRPMAKLRPRSSQGPTASSPVRAARSRPMTSIQLWVSSSSRRRSTTSARAPAGSPTKKSGRLPAV